MLSSRGKGLIQITLVRLSQALVLLLALIGSVLAGPPPLSDDAGKVVINEIQTDGNNNLVYVELYFLVSTNVTNWTLHTNGPGGSASGTCTLPAGTYDAGTFMVIDQSCLGWHTNQREIYLLDADGKLVHYISLWKEDGSQDSKNGGDFGDPADFGSEYDGFVTNLNDIATDFDNYCAEIDGATGEVLWNTGGDCESTRGTSNGGTPVLEWRMDEGGWSGVTGEVTDSSGNANTGTAKGGPTTVAGQICRGGDFDGANDYIQASSLAALRGTASMSFWIKTTQTGRSNTWESPGIAGVEQAGGTDDIFWGWLDSNGRIGISVGNDNTTKSNQAINDGAFHHVVLSRDASAGTYTIHIDGTLNASGPIATGQIGTFFDSIGRIEDTGGTPEYFRGRLDELIIFDKVLNDAQVQQIYEYQSTGKNLDGQTRDVSGCTAITSCFTDDFNSGLGSDWQTMHARGSFGDPKVVNGRLRLTNDTNRVSTAATLLRQFPSSGNRIVVEFDFYAYKNNGNTNAADGITLTLSDRQTTPFPGSFGGSLGYAQRNNGDPGFNGGWLGIGLDEYGNFSNPTEGRIGGPGFRPNAIAIRGSGSGTSGYRYLRGTRAHLNPTVLTDATTPHRYRLTVDHTDGTRAMVSVERDTNDGNGFQTLIDAFDALTQTGQSAIPDRVVLTLTGSTGGSSANHEIDNLEVCANIIEPYDAPIHHFELVRNQASGLTCEPLAVALRACANEDCSTEYTGTFDATLSPVAGWAGGNTHQTLQSNDVVQFLPGASGTYTLGVIDSEPSAAPLTETLCFIGAATTPEANCDVTFNDTGLRFFPSDNPTTPLAYFDLVAGADEGGLSMQAVQTNTSTGVCEGLFTSGGVLDFTGGTECTDPTSCSVGQQVNLTSGGTTTTLPNPEDLIGGDAVTTVPLTFGADSTADFSLNAPDVGIQPLTLSYELPDVEGNPSGNVISQQVNLRVQPARLRLLTITNSAGTQQAPGISATAAAPIFTTAGEPFKVEIQALNALGNATPNFGRTNALPSVNWQPLSSLEAPAAGGGSLATSDGTSVTDGNRWQATIDTSQLAMSAGEGLAFSDLGVIQLAGRIESYLGTGGASDLVVDSDSQRVGRFAPAYLHITQMAINGWGSTPYRYQGQNAMLDPIQFSVQAFAVDDSPVDNYDGDFFKLTLPGAALLEKPTSLAATGGDLIHQALTWTRSNTGDYDGTVDLQGDSVGLVWNRRTVLPTADDTVQNVTHLRIDAASLTDADGVCHGAGAGCADLLLDIADLELGYARVNMENQAAGSISQVVLPAWVEVLDNVDSVNALYDFTLSTLDSETDDSVLTGLDDESPCSPSTLNCASIAATAGLTDPTFTLSRLVNGNGYFVVDNDTGTPGIVGVRAQAPSWLSWGWDEDNTTAMNGASSTLYFGQYQGRPPILFRMEGFR